MVGDDARPAGRRQQRSRRTVSGDVGSDVASDGLRSGDDPHRIIHGIDHDAFARLRVANEVNHVLHLLAKLEDLSLLTAAGTAWVGNVAPSEHRVKKHRRIAQPVLAGLDLGAADQRQEAEARAEHDRTHL